MIELPISREKCSCLQNNFVSVKVLEILFASLNERKIRKIFLRLFPFTASYFQTSYTSHLRPCFTLLFLIVRQCRLFIYVYVYNWLQEKQIN